MSIFFRNVSSSDLDAEIEKYLRSNLKDIDELKDIFISQIIYEFLNNRKGYKENVPYEFFISDYSPDGQYSTLNIVGNIRTTKPLSEFLKGEVFGFSAPQKLFLTLSREIINNENIKKLEVYVRTDQDYFQFEENLESSTNPKAFLKKLEIIGSNVPQKAWLLLDKSVKNYFHSLETYIISDDFYLQSSKNLSSLVSPKEILNNVFFSYLNLDGGEPSVLRISLKNNFYSKVDKVRIYLITDTEYLQGEIYFSEETQEYEVNIYGGANSINSGIFRFEFLKNSEIVLDIFSRYYEFVTLKDLDYLSVSQNIYVYDWSSIISIKFIGTTTRQISLRLGELNKLYNPEELSFVNNIYLNNLADRKIIFVFKDENNSTIYQFDLKIDDLENSSDRFFDKNLFIKTYLSSDILYPIENHVLPIFRKESNGSEIVNAELKIKKEGNSKAVGYFEIFYKNEKAFELWEQTYLPVSYYNFPIQGRFYSYDWALGILALLTEYKLVKNVNEELANGIKRVIENSTKNFLSWINNDGSVNFFYGKYTPYTDKYVRNGAVAWVLEALIKLYNENEFRTSQIASGISSIINYLLSQKSPITGLIMGGLNKYGPNWELINEQITWMSAEHNIDFYFCLREICENSSVYSTFLDTSMICNEKDSLANAIKTHLYLESEERIRQGYNDDAGALDLYTWGTQFLYSIGENPNKVYKNYQYSDVYKLPMRELGYIEGYRAYSEDLGYPNSKNYIWLEGTFQRMYVSALIYKLKDFNLLERLGNIFDSNYKFLPYAIGKDENYDIAEYPSLAATAWFLFVYYLYTKDVKPYWI